MSTTIESLELEITSNSKGAVSGIDALTQSLEKLRSATKGGLGLSAIAKGMQSINNTDMSGGKRNIQSLVEALSPLSALSKSNLSSFITPLKNLPKVFTELGKVDMGAFSTKIQDIATALKPLGDEMQKVANGFNSFPDKIQKLLKATEQIPISNKKASVSFTDLYHKIKLGAKAIVAFGSKVWSAVDKSMDYIENMNLFSVSMGEYAEQALADAEKFRDTLGIDTSEWIRAQGVFMTMATGFGVTSDRAYTMSKNLTQLGYDLSSFYNMDFEDAMTKLKSGLAGELEPLRAIGYDLSQAKLEATALELGITKSVSAMTQAEKAQLRYYAIMTQVTATHGDLARTLDDPANQVRVFKAEISMAAREIGNAFIPALNAILPYAIAIARVIGSLGKTIAGLFGYKDKGLEDTSSSVVENTDSITDNLEDATDEAKKLKSYMLGIDELNVINPNQDSGITDSLSEFEFELPEYDFLEGLVESKVSTIVEEMKEWLGITDDIDTWSEFFDTRLGHILELVGLIGGGILAWKISKGFIDTITAINLLLSTPSYAISIGAIVTITGIYLSIKGMESAIKDGLDEFNFAEIIGGAILTTAGAALLGSLIVAWIGKIASTKLLFAMANLGIKLGYTTAAGMGAGLAFGVTAIIAGVGMMFVGIYDAVTEGIDWLSGLLTAGGATLLGAGIGAFFGPIGILIGAVIGLVVGLVTDLVILIVQKWDEICAWFKGVGDWINNNVIIPVGNFFKGLCKSIGDFFSNLWDGIVKIWNKVATWFYNNVIQPVINFFAPIVTVISQFFEGCWLIIQACWEVASTWFNETFIIPTVEFFRGLWETVSGFFTKLWEDIKGIWNGVATWFDNTVTKPVTNKFEEVWTKVSGFFKQLWEDIKGVWNGVSTWFSETIITPVKTAFDEACSAIGGFFSSLWLGIKQGVVNAMNAVIGAIESALNWVIGGFNWFLSGFDSIVQWAADILGEDWGGMTLIKEVSFGRIPVPTYANGGFPEAGQMFIAREAGAEMVGNIGRRTAVANNDQIVSGIAGGVAEANEEQNILLREQNTLLRAILEKDSGVYLDGRSLSNSVEKYQRERGRVVIAGGVM